MSEQKLTLSVVTSLVPNGKSYIDQEYVDKLNSLIQQDSDAEYVRENLTESLSCLTQGYTPQQFYNAVKFVSYLNAGKSVTESYMLTFPDRVETYNSKEINVSITNYACRFNATKLVKELKKFLLIPTHLLYRDVKYKAIQTLSEMLDNKTVPAKTKVLAANSLLTHLKDPDDGKLTLNVNYENDNVISALRESLTELVAKQRESLIVGTTTLSALGAQRIGNEEDD